MFILQCWVTIIEMNDLHGFQSTEQTFESLKRDFMMLLAKKKEEDFHYQCKSSARNNSNFCPFYCH